MKVSSPLSLLSANRRVLTAAAIAIAVILVSPNLTIISAQQQQLTTGPGEIGNTPGTAGTLFQSPSDSFSILVPNGWVVEDLNNTSFELSEEIRLGYGLLAQLCPEQEQGAQALSPTTAGAANNATGNNRCQGAQEEVVHIIRYPDLNMRMQPTGNLTEYHLQKLQEVGYRNIQITTTTDFAVNLTNPLTNETIQTVPAKRADITYTTAISPNETKIGHYILTSTNNTAPNATATKGYAVFYEDNSGGANTAGGAAAAITPASSGLPLSTQAGQILGSFELIVAPGVAATVEQPPVEPVEFAEEEVVVEEEEEEEATDEEEEEEATDEEEEEDDGGDNDGGDNDGGDNDGGDEGDEGEGNAGEDNLDEFIDCIIIGRPGADPGDVGC